MNKSIEIKEKALRVIETMCEDFSSVYYMNKEICDIFGCIYKMAHAAADTSCEHLEWEKELEETYDRLMKE